MVLLQGQVLPRQEDSHFYDTKFREEHHALHAGIEAVFSIIERPFLIVSPIAIISQVH